MMSSPIQDAQNLDPILKYAPRHVRDQMPRMPPVTPIEWPLRSHREENSRAFSGDRDFLELQRRLALDPGMPEPPPQFTNSRDTWWLTLRIAGVFGIAASVAWVVVSIPGARLRHDQSVQASFINPSISPEMVGEVPTLTPQSERPWGSASVAEAASKRDRLDATAPAPPPAVEVPLINQTPAEIAREQPHSAQPAAPDSISRQLNRDEVTSLLKRGEDFLKAGDLVSARLVFRRAAEAGDARSAFALASTFDSGVLEKFGFAGFWADVAMARMWYQQAAQFGSAEAPQRLQQLATETNP
jgi:hypothetical protein